MSSVMTIILLHSYTSVYHHKQPVTIDDDNLLTKRIYLAMKEKQWFAAKRERERLELNFYKIRTNVVNSLPTTFVKNVEKCERNVKLIIVIHSTHASRDRRNAIRSTWGNPKSSWPMIAGVEQHVLNHLLDGIKIVFMLGMHWSTEEEQLLHEESEKHKDIIQSNFFDSYRNLTLKSLSTISWVNQYCSGALHLIKCDDDTMINIPYVQDLILRTNIFKMQLSPPPQNSSYLVGAKSVNSQVFRAGKWMVNIWQYPFAIYPDYLSGPAYVVPVALTRQLYEASKYIPVITIEDVYLTGIMSRVLNLTLYHVPNFAYTNTQPIQACSLKTGQSYTATNLNASYLIKLWRDFQDISIDCNVVPDEQPTTPNVS